MVTKLRYGNTNTYLVRGEKANVLVDTDYAGTLMLFYKILKAIFTMSLPRIITRITSDW